MTIFQSLYTIKVQFKNEPKRSKDNNQSKHLLAKQSISMIKIQVLGPHLTPISGLTVIIVISTNKKLILVASFCNRDK